MLQTFLTVEEMVRYYEREALILYSGGELTGTTRLKAPPPGLVRSPTTKSAELRRNSLVNVGRRPSEGVHRSSNAAGLRTLSFGSAEVPFNLSRPSEDFHRYSAMNGLRTFSSENFDDFLSAQRNLTSEKVQNLSAPAGFKTHSYESVKGPLSGSGQPYTEEILTVSAVHGVQTFSSERNKNSMTNPKNQTETAGHSTVSDVLETLSSGNVMAAPTRSSMSNRRAISTPNIDIPGKSSDKFHRRRSCDNLSAIIPPPAVYPRSPSSFKETQRHFVKSYPSLKSGPSSSLYHHHLNNRTFSPLPTAVHIKIPTLSLSMARSNPPDCSC